MSGHGANDTLALRNPRIAAAVVDLFVYVVVLNLFVEYFPKVLVESFSLSLLTAVLLKVVLEVVVLVEKRVKVRFRHATTGVGKAIAAVLLWVVLIGSKFIVLEVINLAFGSRVDLGGFIPVALLIISLLLARAGVRRLLQAAPAPVQTHDPPVAGQDR